jgi:hypothetical protein
LPPDADLPVVLDGLRIVDQLLVERDRAFIVLAESDRAGARALLVRLERCGAVADAVARSRIAVFRRTHKRAKHCSQWHVGNTIFTRQTPR